MFKHYNVKHCIKVHITTAITSLIPRQRCPIKWWCLLQPNPPPVRKNLRKGKVCKIKGLLIKYDFNFAICSDQNMDFYLWGMIGFFSLRFPHCSVWLVTTWSVWWSTVFSNNPPFSQTACVCSWYNGAHFAKVAENHFQPYL